jgi:hypothetical protein
MVGVHAFEARRGHGHVEIRTAAGLEECREVAIPVAEVLPDMWRELVDDGRRCGVERSGFRHVAGVHRIGELIERRKCQRRFCGLRPKYEHRNAACRDCKPDQVVHAISPEMQMS